MKKMACHPLNVICFLFCLTTVLLHVATILTDKDILTKDTSDINFPQSFAFLVEIISLFFASLACILLFANIFKKRNFRLLRAFATSFISASVLSGGIALSVACFTYTGSENPVLFHITTLSTNTTDNSTPPLYQEAVGNPPVIVGIVACTTGIITTLILICCAPGKEHGREDETTTSKMENYVLSSFTEKTIIDEDVHPKQSKIETIDVVEGRRIAGKLNDGYEEESNPRYTTHNEEEVLNQLDKELRNEKNKMNGHAKRRIKDAPESYYSYNDNKYGKERRSSTIDEPERDYDVNVNESFYRPRQSDYRMDQRPKSTKMLRPIDYRKEYL